MQDVRIVPTLCGRYASGQEAETGAWWRRAVVRPPAEQIKAVGEAKKSLTDTGVGDLRALVDDLADSPKPLANDAERASEARASIRDVPVESAGVVEMRD